MQIASGVLHFLTDLMIYAFHENNIYYSKRVKEYSILSYILMNMKESGAP